MEGDRVVGIRTPAGVERARVVIGADGVRSSVATRTGAEEYKVEGPRLSACYTFYSGIHAVDGAQMELYAGTHRSAFILPTNDGRYVAGVNWASHELESMSKDTERSYHATVEALSPSLARRLRAGRREANFVTGRLPKCYLRKAFGPGWALAGDAGALYEYSTAQGITNAFRQAALISRALDDALSGRRRFEDAMSEFERRRNEIEIPYYDFTHNQGTFQPLDPSDIPLYSAVAKSEQATSSMLGLFSQTTSPAAFFAPESLGSIMGDLG